MTPDDTPAMPESGSTHWRRTRRLTLQLLAAWGAITFAMIFFARELAQITILGWPLSFYMAAQGTLLAYLAIVAIYAWRMQRLDRICKDGQDNAR